MADQDRKERESVGKGFFYAKNREGGAPPYYTGTIEVEVDGVQMVMKVAMFPTKSPSSKASFVLNVNSVQTVEEYRSGQATRQDNRPAHVKEALAQAKREEEDPVPF